MHNESTSEYLAENELLKKVLDLFPSAPTGELWAGDDMAVFSLEVVPFGSPGKTKEPFTDSKGHVSDNHEREKYLLFASDCLVENVHFDTGFSSYEDIGYKAISVNVSDAAAMGALPYRAVVSLAAPSSRAAEQISVGIKQASEQYACPVVGGDLSYAKDIFISVAVIATSLGQPVLRTGAKAGDLIFVTGPLGAGYAALRYLKDNPGCQNDAALRHRRPEAKISSGLAAKEAGAKAMMDLSDGLLVDLERLAKASGVGVDLESCPCHPLATQDDALYGGDDYELLFTATDQKRVEEKFLSYELEPPICIGKCVEDATVRLWQGEPVEMRGFQHMFETG
ncbi:MAG: thiamine-phosphate kinase [Firmicutes bacterium]|nr:thiamine-phosphate kinase [Bacillota bacterium]